MTVSTSSQLASCSSQGACGSLICTPAASRAARGERTAARTGGVTDGSASWAASTPTANRGGPVGPVGLGGVVGATGSAGTAGGAEGWGGGDGIREHDEQVCGAGHGGGERARVIAAGREREDPFDGEEPV